jgi:hypothetical protein
VDVPEMKYMMIDGAGNPEDAEFKAAVKWLFSLAHIIKPHVREKLGKRFVEPPLECLFWTDRPKPFSRTSKEDWKWRVMIVMLDIVTEDIFSEAVARAAARLGPAPVSLKLEYHREGRCVQTMHVGDYSGVAAVCHDLYEKFLPSRRLKPAGHYHEIYLNDPDRVAPDKRKVVIRQPVA